MSQAGIVSLTESGGGGNIPINFVTDSGTATAIANTLFVNGAGGTSTSVGASNQIIITCTGGSTFTWNVVTSATNVNQIVVNNGYICNGASLVTFLLPLAPAIGDSFKIVSNTARFQISENGSQQIRIGAEITSAGSGTLTSNTVGDFITAVYVGSNIFICEAPEGTLTLL